MSIRSALVLGGALLIAGCAATGSATPPAGDGGSSGLPVLTIVDAIPEGPAIQVGQALAVSADLPLRVTGALFVGPDGTVFLCSAIAESFPPQCGGDRIRVVGLDLTTIELQSANDVSWAESVEIVGRVGA